MRGEKLLPMKREWVEKYVVCKMKKKSLKLVFKDKQKEAKTTKQCSEKLMKKDKKKDEKQ